MKTADVAVQAGPAITDWLQAIASFATMTFALAALFIAFKAPKWAAQWAEKLRTQNEAAAEKRRLEMHVFTVLMARRGAIASPEAVSALNLIDVVFVEEQRIRTAFRSFMEAANAQPFEGVVLLERYFALIERIAEHLGLHHKITSFDVRASYYPTVLFTLDQAVLADAEEKLARKAAAR